MIIHDADNDYLVYKREKEYATKDGGNCTSYLKIQWYFEYRWYLYAREWPCVFSCVCSPFTEIGGEDGIVPAAFHDRVWSILFLSFIYWVIVVRIRFLLFQTNIRIVGTNKNRVFRWKCTYLQKKYAEYFVNSKRVPTFANAKEKNTLRKQAKLRLGRIKARPVRLSVMKSSLLFLSDSL